MFGIDEKCNRIGLWSGYNFETGEAIYGKSKSEVWASILRSECFKSLSRTETYTTMAEILSQWNITAIG